MLRVGLRHPPLVPDDRLCRLFGIDAQTFDGRVETFFDAIHPQDPAAVETAVAESIESCGDYRAEYRVIRPAAVRGGSRPGEGCCPASAGGPTG